MNDRIHLLPSRNALHCGQEEWMKGRASGVSQMQSLILTPTVQKITAVYSIRRQWREYFLQCVAASRTFFNASLEVSYVPCAPATANFLTSGLKTKHCWTVYG